MVEVRGGSGGSGSLTRDVESILEKRGVVETNKRMVTHSETAAGCYCMM